MNTTARLPAGSTRTVQWSVYLRPAEATALRMAANAKRMTASDFLMAAAEAYLKSRRAPRAPTGKLGRRRKVHGYVTPALDKAMRARAKEYGVSLACALSCAVSIYAA